MSHGYCHGVQKLSAPPRARHTMALRRRPASARPASAQPGGSSERRNRPASARPAATGKAAHTGRAHATGNEGTAGTRRDRDDAQHTSGASSNSTSSSRPSARPVPASLTTVCIHASDVPGLVVCASRLTRAAFSQTARRRVEPLGWAWAADRQAGPSRPFPPCSQLDCAQRRPFRQRRGVASRDRLRCSARRASRYRRATRCWRRGGRDAPPARAR